MKYLILLVFSFGLHVHAEEAVSDANSCKTVAEKRALLYNKEVCALEISCDTAGSDEAKVPVKENAYCRPDAANACPDAKACMEDKSVSKADIPMLIPKYTGSVGPIKSTGAADTGNSCACAPDKSKRTDGSKRSEGPAKIGAPDGAANKRTEGASGRGVN